MERKEKFTLIEEKKEEKLAVEETLFFENQRKNGENAKRLLTAKEAADYLGGRFTEQAIRLKKFRGEIPHFQIGADVYFTRETLEVWLQSHFVPAIRSRGLTGNT